MPLLSFERLVGCCSPEQGLENVHEDADGGLVTLLRSEKFFAHPLELRGHELEHVVVKGAAVVAGGTSGCVRLCPLALTFGY